MAYNQTSKMCRRTKADDIYTYCEIARISQGSTVAVGFLSRVFETVRFLRNSMRYRLGSFIEIRIRRSSKEVARKDFGIGAELLGFRYGVGGINVFRARLVARAPPM
jgi:hypothetical protein